ncbi:hypothetical protein BX666DRAFT_1906673 [Dichotomocladium elegans]|nr:hypothetical protein BX666DRAFT_1906673 [Dichotomocladium elegans]
MRPGSPLMAVAVRTLFYRHCLCLVQLSNINRRLMSIITRHTIQPRHQYKLNLPWQNRQDSWIRQPQAATHPFRHVHPQPRSRKGILLLWK